MSKDDILSLKQDLALAIELAEPETILETLRRSAARMAADGSTGSLEAQRWRELAQALEGAQKTLAMPPTPQNEGDQPDLAQSGY
jgi:hypothetical protein